MKKYIYYICLLLVAFVDAQEVDTKDVDILSFDKGTQFVNTNLSARISDGKIRSLNDDTITEYNRESFSIRGSYAYAIANDLFVGVGLRYGHWSNTNDSSNPASDSKSSSNLYGIFPYVRYYKGVGKKLALYLQGETSFRHVNFDWENTNSFSVGLRPGITFMMSKNLAFETSLGFLGYFSNSSEEEGRISESNSKAFRASFDSSNLLFGLNYYF